MDRLLADFDQSVASMRKALSFKDGLVKHQACGGFLHYLKSFERMCPAAKFPEISEQLTKQFHMGFLDPDLLFSLESQVPPGDIKSISAFRRGLQVRCDGLHSGPAGRTCVLQVRLPSVLCEGLLCPI